MKPQELHIHLGIVKWFGDQAKKANYGFIHHVALGDLFFHENNIESNQDANKFKEGEVVIFVPKPSQKHDGKLNATSVKIFDTEDNLKILFTLFLNLFTKVSTEPDYYSLFSKVKRNLSRLLENGIDDDNGELFKQYESFLRDQIDFTHASENSRLKDLLWIGKSFFSEHYNQLSKVVEERLPPEMAHQLWLDRYIVNCQVDYVANTIWQTDELTLERIFALCTDEEKAKIFAEAAKLIDTKEGSIELNTIEKLLQIAKKYAIDQYDSISATMLSFFPAYINLSLWIRNYHDVLDFNSYKFYTITLSPDEQKTFVKKVLKHIHEGRVSVSVDDLTSINVINFKTSIFFESEVGYTLDYSTSIILNVLSELYNQAIISPTKNTREALYKIYDLVLKQIAKPDDILKITGYFDECQGRCGITVHEEKNEQGEVISKSVSYCRNEYRKPKFHPICDGRKAINKMSNSPSLYEEVEFWWCANERCFQPSRQLHASENWENYSLMDFLTILDIQYEEADLVTYLNLINKANRFFRHLKCRKCNHIIRPIKQSNYAFYGVNEFHCTNEHCTERGEKIYLTHCSNGFCDNTIDSRDSVKCKPDGADSGQHGWYVCNYCHACCSREKIEGREYILKATGQEYKGHKNGHRDLGIICCNKCGNSMHPHESNQAEYQKALAWFIDHRNDSQYIEKSGKNGYGGWWFRFTRSNLSHDDYYKKLDNLMRLGFDVPTFEDFGKPVQLVAEPKNRSVSNTFFCSNTDCRNTLNLSSISMERKRAIVNYHEKLFPKLK